ncbi:MAG: hypothetical protein CBE23_001415 [Candidatus Pelagibacter sp. TMED263]|nr:MAG: hypothetical protein CBE23_001415 [Candidatus Pelagibacter sp. TMED263]|tara:strand:+ start:1240 stop:2307 length:1068 start_codon:yes stop_codon:yes gene_type:complete
MKLLKIFSYNLIFFFLFILIIEIIFGFWFDKNNLGPYMREHRMKKIDYTMKIDDIRYDYTYKRNYHGFIGEEIKLDKIKAIMVGGSTTDERYKPENFRIAGILNKKLLEKKIDLKIISAGIEGQSTIGHLNNFKVWFPKLENFQPKIIIFYVGINDHLTPVKEMKNLMSSDGMVKNPKKTDVIKDYLKSSSIFYDLARKIKHRYYTSGKTRIVYDFNENINNLYKNKSFDFLSYNDALSKYNLNELLNRHQERINYYLSNIDKLNNATKRIGATPIFINQLMSGGNNNEALFALNYSLIKHCQKNNYNCIDLAKKLMGKKDFWWDGIHTTIKGSNEISNMIFPELYDFILEIDLN